MIMYLCIVLPNKRKFSNSKSRKSTTNVLIIHDSTAFAMRKRYVFPSQFDMHIIHNADTCLDFSIHGYYFMYLLRIK